MKMSQVLGFLNIYPQIKNQKLKLPILYKLNKCFEFCNKEAEFYRTQLKEICDKYGQRDENDEFKYDEKTGNLLIQLDHIKECEDEMNSLLGIEVTLDDNYKIPADALDSIEMDMESFQAFAPFLK